MLLFTAHGGSTQDGRLTVDGINTGSSRGGSGVSSYVPDIQNTRRWRSASRATSEKPKPADRR